MNIFLDFALLRSFNPLKNALKFVIFFPMDKTSYFWIYNIFILSIPVYEHLSDDIPKSIKPWLEELLEHYKVHL